ncbi:PDZ domain-containing protein [Pontimonas sp.]|nr:PDZ domain-containing protein [Pontimonas sp.]
MPVRPTGELRVTIFETEDPSDHVQRRSRVAGWLMLSFTLVIVLGLSFFPAPYVIDNPGPTYDTLGAVTVGEEDMDLIVISGNQTYESSGSLLLTTVTRSGNPESLPGWFDVMQGWFDPTRTVIPVDVAYPPGITVEQNREAAAIEMENSQQEAVAAALEYLGIPYTSRMVVSQALEGGPSEGVLMPGDVIVAANQLPVETVSRFREMIADSGVVTPMTVTVERDGALVDVEILPRMSEGPERVPMVGILVSGTYDFPLEVDIALENVGGPSAGLMFALGIVEKLTVEDLTNGRVVAGTGTIDAQGSIGPIGGIRHKMQGALNDGATWFLAPIDNCADVLGHIPEGLSVTPVATLADAVEALELIHEGAALPVCETP